MVSHGPVPGDGSTPPDRPRQNEDARKAGRPAATERQASNRFERLLEFRERLKRSSQRPDWWAGHLRGYFR